MCSTLSRTSSVVLILFIRTILNLSENSIPKSDLGAPHTRPPNPELRHCVDCPWPRMLRPVASTTRWMGSPLGGRCSCTSSPLVRRERGGPGGSLSAGKLHERTEESFDTAPEQPKQALQGKGQLDTWIGVLALTTSLARRQRRPSAECGVRTR